MSDHRAIRFKQTKIPRQTGELARLKVVKGPDYGAIYVIIGHVVQIGRGEECDIKLLDLKASRVHAGLSLEATNVWVLKDTGSANGISFQGKWIRETKLKSGDFFTLGETSLEFQSADVGTMQLMTPPRSIEQFELEQSVFEQQKNKVKAMGLAALFSGTMGQSAGGSNVSKQSMDQSLRKKILYVGVAAFAILLFLLPDDSKKKTSTEKKNDQVSEESRDLASYLPNVSSSTRTTDTFFKDGFREYIAGNFNRARVQFETVLQIVPGHSLATIYLENCNKAINSEVKFHIDYGKKSYDAGKLRESRAHYERIIRLLFKDQSNENFIKAKEYYEKVNNEIKSFESDSPMKGSNK